MVITQVDRVGGGSFSKLEAQLVLKLDRRGPARELHLHPHNEGAPAVHLA